MSIRSFFVVAVCIACTTSSFASTCPTTNVIQEPPLFQWTHHPSTANNPEEYYSGTLDMGEVTLTIAGETITTRAYGQAGFPYTIPGPTLVMVPGNKYVLRFRNTLPYEPPNQNQNVFKDPNVTNLHTHGLHLSGESPGDDVTRFFEGGFGGDFVYDIQPDHMGGTFWYHAHHHGSTYLQVSSGAFGLIVIDDSSDGIPSNVADMAERQLLVAFLDPSVAGTGGDTLITGTLNPTWTVNGNVAGNLCMPPNTWQHWRILLADRDARTKTVTVGSSCEVALMARDGVWRTEVPKTLTNNSINLTGASRADLAVRCSNDSSISVGNELVANVFVDGTSDTGPHPYNPDGVSTWFSKRPSYLRDLRSESPDNSETVRMGARTINGKRFDHAVPTFTLPATGLQEWSLNGARNHPFHLHIYHVQVVGNCGEFEDGEFYDVVAQNCTLRFDLDATTSTVYEGRTIMHCHILEHEDQGAMGWTDVLGGILPPVFPTDGDSSISYSDYYPFGNPGGGPPSAPTGLAAATASSSEIGLGWTDTSSDEESFEIERSLDGSNFSFLASTSSNVTSYSDMGLDPATTYYYRVFADNSFGASSYSNTASATTDPAGTATVVEVGSITVSTVNIGRGNKVGRAEIVVRDDQGGLVSGAVVSGEFTGTFTEAIAASSPTDGNGLTVIDTSGSAKGSVSVTFCVTGITHPTLDDFSGQICASL